MADITVKCSSCGTENRVSEYAAAETLVCRSCKRALSNFHTEDRKMRLQVRKIERDDKQTNLTGEKEEEEQEVAIRKASAERTSSVLGEVHKARTKTSNPHAIVSWLAFLAVGALLVGLQYLSLEDPKLLQPYYTLRWVALGLFSFLVILIAFQDSTFQGVLCLLLPLYIVYYAVVRVESYFVRGAFMAVCVALGTEMHFMPKQAVVTRTQIEINKFINSVGKQVQRASEAPDMPPPKRYHRGSKR